MESIRDLSRNVKIVMQQSGLSVNLKTLEIHCLSGIATENQIQKLVETFGQVDSFEMRDGGYFVTYAHSYEAMIAKETMDSITFDDIGFQLKVDWVKSKEAEMAFEIIPTPEVFVPVIRKAANIKAEPPESLKYIARFPINLQDSDNFHLKEKILGAKGCNFKKIVEICAKDVGIPERPKDLIELRIIYEPEFNVVVKSKFCSKFNTACALVYELITVVFEEYKRFCEIQGTNPGDLRIRKLEQIKGRCRILKEKKIDPSVYSIAPSLEGK
jgi:hypothetical protein